MDRKLWGLFSGTHLTIMFAAAMATLVPGALYAIDSFSNVAIEDPVTGIKARIERPGSLNVFDKVASYAQTPANFVHIFGFPTCSGGFYTVPAGKALIIQSMTAYMSAITAGSRQEVELYSQADCNGGIMAAAITDARDDAPSQSFGSGIAIPAGSSLSAFGNNFDGTFQLYGYLVPAGAVPPESMAQIGVQQGTRTTRRR